MLEELKKTEVNIFKLSDEEVDKLRDAARRILTQSKDFQQLLRDLKHFLTIEGYRG